MRFRRLDENFGQFSGLAARGLVSWASRRAMTCSMRVFLDALEPRPIPLVLALPTPLAQPFSPVIRYRFSRAGQMGLAGLVVSQFDYKLLIETETVPLG